jgi:hypothetical protein
MKVVPLDREPIRALIVEPFNSSALIWQASYAGDEWTNELLFNPPMKLPLLLAELKQWKGRNGLPIVVQHRREMAA